MYMCYYMYMSYKEVNILNKPLPFVLRDNYCFSNPYEYLNGVNYYMCCIDTSKRLIAVCTTLSDNDSVSQYVSNPSVFHCYKYVKSVKLYEEENLLYSYLFLGE